MTETIESEFPEGLTILHKLDDEPYRRWCSVRGVRRAARWGATAIDIDVKLTRDGVPVAVHWERTGRGGFRDPAGVIGATAKVGRLLAEQVTRLVSVDGYRIWRTRRLMREAARLGVTLCLEAKPDLRFANPEVWEQVAADADSTGASVIVMSQPHAGVGIDALEAAHGLLPTLLLSRGAPRPKVWQHLDYVKGPRRWTEGAPPEVRVVGGRPGIATRWGCSCKATRESVASARRAVERAARKNITR